jgi:hypothetical protein
MSTRDFAAQRSSKAVALAIGLVALTLLLIPYIYQYENVIKLMFDIKDAQRNRSSSSTKPMFVLHIGPPKTATSAIQCDLTRYRKELYESASVAYLGRIYGHCLKSEDGKEHSFDPKSLIDSCFENGNCKEQDAWKSLESELAYLSAQKKHVILSGESFAKMQVISRNHDDNRKLLYDLVNKYYPGRMRVAIVYRRYYEWLHSMWNEWNKPFVNGNGDDLKYKPTYQNWPSEGGKRCSTFLSYYMERIVDKQPGSKKDDYLNIAEANQVHPAEYLRGLWRNHSSEVQVLNLREMNAPSEDGGDTISRFLRSTVTPLAAKTYIRSKDSGFAGRRNPSRNSDYDMLAVAAHENGLLANITIPRAKVAVFLEENLMKTLNTTALPLKCPNEELLKRFLQKSLHYEEMLYPSQSDSEVKEHEIAFYEAVKKKKFCNLDVDALMEDERFRAFIAKEIPRLQ